MMTKIIFLLGSMFMFIGCSTKDYLFVNDDFNIELDKFIDEYENKGFRDENTIIITLVDAKDVFGEDYKGNKKNIYLIFYYSPPETCDGFYASFYYKGKNIML